jgi:hypothetical protein
MYLRRIKGLCPKKGDVMADIITRVYGSYENALAAVNELKLYRFLDSEITVVSLPTARRAGANMSPPAFNEIVDAIAAGWVVKSDAAIYALSVMRGAALVTVRAPFGTGGRASTILDSHDPVESGVTPKEFPRMRQWDDSTPASSFLHLPVLLDHEATPLSAVLGLPLVAKRGRTLGAVLRIPEVFSTAASKATLFGLPAVMKGSPAITALLGLPAVIRGSAYLSSALHIPLLLSDKASLSGLLDMGWLRAWPTPLSSLLHIPTLMNSSTSLTGVPTSLRSTTVSSRVGIPTLTKGKFLRF